MDLDIGSIAKTALSVGKNVADAFDNPVQALLELPNNLGKVIETTTGIVKDLQKGDTAMPKRVPLLAGKVESLTDHAILEQVKTDVPVITATQIPSSHAMTVELPPMKETVYTDANGRVCHRFDGTCHVINVISVAGSVDLQPVVQQILTCGSPTLFGSRIANQISPIYQRWRLLKYTLLYTPYIGSTFSGTVTLTFLDGATVTAVPTKDGVMQRDNKIPTDMKVATRLSHIPCDALQWKYVTTDATDFDRRLYTFGVAEAYYSDTTTAYGMGNLSASFSIEFCGAVETSIADNALYFALYGIRQAWVSGSELLKFRPFISLFSQVLHRISDEWEAEDEVTNHIGQKRPLGIMARAQKLLLVPQRKGLKALSTTELGPVSRAALSPAQESALKKVAKLSIATRDIPRLVQIYGEIMSRFQTWFRDLFTLWSGSASPRDWHNFVQDFVDQIHDELLWEEDPVLDECEGETMDQ